MIFSRIRAALVCGALAASLPLAALAQTTHVVLALPTTTLTFATDFLAADAGYFKDEGLDVTMPTLVGVASINAVINGSADFADGTGPVFLRAAAHGQRLLAIANLIDRPMVEMVLRKDVYDALDMPAGLSLAERGKYLKGKTIAIQGVGSIVHAWERFVVARAGLDPENDVRIAPMDPPAMLPALVTKAVDGFTTSLPYTTEAVMTGAAMMFASSPRGDAPDILPFADGLIMTKPETCKAPGDKCRHLVRALARANALIRAHPDQALDMLRPRYKEMKPELLEAAWRVVAPAHTEDLRVTMKALENSEKVNIEAKLLDPKDKLASYDGLTSDDYLP